MIANLDHLIWSSLGNTNLDMSRNGRANQWWPELELWPSSVKLIIAYYINHFSCLTSPASTPALFCSISIHFWWINSPCLLDDVAYWAARSPVTWRMKMALYRHVAVEKRWVVHAIFFFFFQIFTDDSLIHSLTHFTHSLTHSHCWNHRNRKMV